MAGAVGRALSMAHRTRAQSSRGQPAEPGPGAESSEHGSQDQGSEQQGATCRARAWSGGSQRAARCSDPPPRPLHLPRERPQGFDQSLTGVPDPTKGREELTQGQVSP